MPDMYRDLYDYFLISAGFTHHGPEIKTAGDFK